MHYCTQIFSLKLSWFQMLKNNCNHRALKCIFQYKIPGNNVYSESKISKLWKGAFKSSLPAIELLSITSFSLMINRTFTSQIIPQNLFRGTISFSWWPSDDCHINKSLNRMFEDRTTSLSRISQRLKAQPVLQNCSESLFIYKHIKSKF